MLSSPPDGNAGSLCEDRHGEFLRRRGMGAKQRLKRILRPVVRPFLPPFGALVRRAVRPEFAEVEAIRRQLDFAIPAILSRISSQAASERGYARSMVQLNDRIEFVRRELLFELRYREPETQEKPSTMGRIVNSDKFAEMKGRVRVNLGAGHIALPGYLNLDGRELPDIDVVASVDDLPFEAGTLTEIFSAHLLEHFPVEELRKVLLPHWVSMLVPGGKFVAVVPDMESMIAACAAGEMSFDAFREVTYGAQEYEGDFHFNGFSSQSLCQLFEEAGLSAVTVRETGRPNGLCLEMEIEGSRPAPTTA